MQVYYLLLPQSRFLGLRHVLVRRLSRVRFHVSHSWYEHVLSYPEAVIITSKLGGAYHYAIFLAEPRYRRVIGYLVGWFDYFALIFAVSAINSILAGLVMALVIIWKPDFVVTGRWELFLLYEAFAVISWLLNLCRVSTVPVLSTFGCKSKHQK